MRIPTAEQSGIWGGGGIRCQCPAAESDCDSRSGYWRNIDVVSGAQGGKIGLNSSTSLHKFWRWRNTLEGLTQELLDIGKQEGVVLAGKTD